MESFYSLMCVMGMTSATYLEELQCKAMDILSGLPVEMAITIFRLLDPASLLSSALVNRKWLRVCRGDAVLRTRIRQQLRRVRRNRVEHAGSRVTVTRDLQQQSSNRLFAHRNHNGKVVSGGEQAGSPMRPQFWPSREVSVAYKMTSRPRTQSLRFRQVPTAVPLRPRANSAPESTLGYRRPIRL